MRDIDKYADGYVKVLLKEFESYQVKYRRRMVLEQIEKYKPHQILEIGCGMEPLFCWAKNKDFTIVEPSTDFCENAKKLAEMEKCNVQILQGFFEETKCSEKYDMIICSSLLHEVENPEKLLKQISATCTKDTIVHINVPNAMSVHRLLARECGLIQDVTDMSEKNQKMQQYSVFTMESLIKLVEKNEVGFSVLDKGSYFIKPFTHAQMSKLMEHHIIDETILDGFYGLAKYMPDLGSEIFINCKLK